MSSCFAVVACVYASRVVPSRARRKQPSEQALTGEGDTAPGPRQVAQVFGRPVVDSSSRGSAVPAVFVGSFGNPTGAGAEKGRPAFVRDRGGGFRRRQVRGFGAATGAPEGRMASLCPVLADSVAALGTPKPANLEVSIWAWLSTVSTTMSIYREDDEFGERERLPPPLHGGGYFNRSGAGAVSRLPCTSLK